MTKDETQKLVDFFNSEIDKSRKMLSSFQSLRELKIIQDRIRFYQQKIEEITP
jgi:hypothetical protein